MEEMLSQKPHQIISFYKLSCFITEEAAVKITVPSNTEIRVMLQHRFHSTFAILFQHGIGNTIWKGSIRFIIDFYKPERHIFFQFVQYCTGAAVTRIYYNFDRFQLGTVNVLQNVFHIRLHNILPGQDASRFSCHQVMGEIVPSYHLLNFQQTGINSHRPCIPPHQFQTVILCRIMAGSNHDTAIHIQECSSKIYHFRTALADINYISASILQPVTQRLKQFRSRQANITAYNNRFCSE